MIDGFTTHLLGRHVAHGTHDDPGLGQRRRRLERAGLGPHLGEPKIENLDETYGRKKHIRRLEIAVHDRSVMRCRQPVRQLSRVVDGLAQGQRPAFERRLKRLALEKF